MQQTTTPNASAKTQHLATLATLQKYHASLQTTTPHAFTQTGSYHEKNASTDEDVAHVERRQSVRQWFGRMYISTSVKVSKQRGASC
jgi:hypothetical protein